MLENLIKTPMVRCLFLINVAIFILTLFCGFLGLGDQFAQMFALYNYRTEMFRPWQLLTHMFVHGGFMHIIFNMIAFASIAPIVEDKIGSRKFLAYYLICGFAAAFLHMILVPSNIPLIGASGAIYGIILMFAYLFPNEKLYFMLMPIGIKAKYLVTCIFLFEIYLGFSGVNDGVGHWAHVAGGFTGLILVSFEKLKTKFL